MKKNIMLGALVFMATSSPVFARGWIVKLNRTQSPDGFLKSQGLKGRILDSRTTSRWLKVETPAVVAGKVSTLSVGTLSTMSGVEYVEEDRVVSINMGPGKPADPEDPAVGQPEITPNDTHYSKLWGLAGVNTIGSTRAPHAWYHARNRTLATVVVAVLDTGVNYEHEDIKPILWSGKVDGKSVRGIDTVRHDFVADDENSHGTHVSGTIAGKSNNSRGIAGIATNAKIFPMKFLDAEGSGETSAAIEAIDMALENPEIKVMNHSWGGEGGSKALDEAFERARARGILMVVAAGNSKINNDSKTVYPANIALDNVISVAAIDSAEKLATFSNYGKKKVHLGAPGVDIFSSVLGSTTAYDTYSGTSMASPHVAGAAAFIWGLKPQWTYQEVRDQLLKNVRPLSSLTKKTTSGGTLDLYRAVRDL